MAAAASSLHEVLTLAGSYNELNKRTGFSSAVKNYGLHAALTLSVLESTAGKGYLLPG